MTDNIPPGEPEPAGAQAQPSSGDAEKSARTLLIVTYALFALGFFIGLTSIAAIIICHLKVGSAPNALIGSHYRWLIRSFWFAVLGGIVGWILTFIFIGIIVLIVVGLWYIYRLVKGFVRLMDDQPIDDPTAWY